MLDSGYEIIKDFISQDQLYEIISEIEASAEFISESGIRNAEKKFNRVNLYLNSKEFFAAAKPYLDSSFALVRAIIFNKTPTTNWFVTWHQDKTIAVSERISEIGWEPWSLKDGVHHVQPPISILENMVTIRIHLDRANKENGCLKVVPFSHKLGILKQDGIAEHTQNSEAVFCEVDKGDALIMQPLLLHSSSKCIAPNNRRVLHLEYSNYLLPNGLKWC
ncbi:hypothetical protein MCAMS1_00820 [biofilm metagenome]